MQENEEVRGNDELQEGDEPREQRGKRINLKDVLLVIYALITVVAVVIAVRAVSARLNAGKELQPVEKLTDSISIPQFESLELKADTLEQDLVLWNPEENYAKFRISIVLNDEVLWESKLLQPGEKTGPIVLTKTLPAGEYEARLVYNCFADDEEQSPLNGADSPIKLKVD